MDSPYPKSQPFSGKTSMALMSLRYFVMEMDWSHIWHAGQPFVRMDCVEIPCLAGRCLWQQSQDANDVIDNRVSALVRSNSKSTQLRSVWL